MPSLDLIFKPNDIRGIVPDQLDSDIVRIVARSFGRKMRGEGLTSAVVGHDMRLSGDQLASAAIEGLNLAGLDVLDTGLISTDMLYYASGSRKLPGIMLTASHNPADYNGMKMCYPGARPLGPEDMAELKEQTQQALDGSKGANPDSQGPQPGSKVERLDLLGEYARFLRSVVRYPVHRPLRVVVDAGNAMAGLTAPAVLGSAAGLADLGIDLIGLNMELDGTFPAHPPNPLEEKNLADLKEAVVQQGADLGLAFDGDADRCFVIDETGTVVPPSAIALMVGLQEAQRESERGDHSVIVHNLITSRALPDLLRQAKIETVVTPVGHSFIKRAMAKNNAVFGGEHSAHFYFRDFFYADSGLLASLHVLSLLADSTGTMSELAQTYSPYYASGEINFQVADPAAMMERVAVVFGDREPQAVQSRIDGLMIDHWDRSPRWWANIRRSNTEPLLRLNVEAQDEDVMAKIRDAVVGIIAE